MSKGKMPADWLEYVAKLERDIKKTPTPRRRLQPKVTRHQSGRQRAAFSQTRSFTRASYNLDATPTPIRANEDGLTRNLELPNWSTGKATDSR